MPRKDVSLPLHWYELVAIFSAEFILFFLLGYGIAGKWGPGDFGAVIGGFVVACVPVATLLAFVRKRMEVDGRVVVAIDGDRIWVWNKASHREVEVSLVEEFRDPQGTTSSSSSVQLYKIGKRQVLPVVHPETQWTWARISFNWDSDDVKRPKQFCYVLTRRFANDDWVVETKTRVVPTEVLERYPDLRLS